MNLACIVQARISSQRLPGKVLLKLGNKSVLGHVVERLKFCKTFEKIIIATSIDKSDNLIEKWCEENNVVCYRGSLNDVLDRYYQAVKHFELDSVIRITADCPLIDPLIVDRVVRGFKSDIYDAFSLAGEFPDGLDCQVFSKNAIQKAWENAKLPSEREHVGVYIEKTNPEKFKLGNIKPFKNLASMRWTLDEKEDFEFLKKIFENLYRSGQIFHTEDILRYLEYNPEIISINSKIKRNEGYYKSLEKDFL